MVPFFSLYDRHHEDSLVVDPLDLWSDSKNKGVRLHMKRPEYLDVDSSERSIGADVRARDEPDEEEDEDDNDHHDEDDEEENDDGYSE